MVRRTDRARARLESGLRPALDGGPPPEFGGVPTTWSPEHLLISSLGLCLYTTFEALASREQLEILDWTGEVEAIVDKTTAGIGFTSFWIGLDIQVAPGDIERAEKVLERAKRHCLVSNVLKVPVEVTSRVTAASSAA